MSKDCTAIITADFVSDPSNPRNSPAWRSFFARDDEMGEAPKWLGLADVSVRQSTIEYMPIMEVRVGSMGGLRQAKVTSREVACPF